MEINLEELREAARLLHEMAIDAEKILPVLQFMEKNPGAVLPAVTDRLVRTGEAAKILGIGKTQIGQLVKAGALTPLYVDSAQRKFWLSEVQALPKKTPPRPKPDNLGDKRGRRKKS